jgi:hypothetical protein
LDSDAKKKYNGWSEKPQHHTLLKEAVVTWAAAWSAITETASLVAGAMPLLKRVEVLVHLRAQTIEAEGVDNPIKIEKGRTVVLPAGTEAAKITGSYWLHPGSTPYAIFVLKGGKYWLKSDINIAAHSTWTAELSINSPGSRRIILVKLSPEILMLRQFYFDIFKQIDKSYKAMADAGVAIVDLNHHVESWQPLSNLDRLPTFKSIQEFEVVVKEEE